MRQIQRDRIPEMRRAPWQAPLISAADQANEQREDTTDREDAQAMPPRILAEHWFSTDEIRWAA